MVIIDEFFDTGFKWAKYNNIYVKGYAIIENRYYDANAIGLYIEKKYSLDDIDCIMQFVKNLYGMYAIIIENKNRIFLITDIVRAFPIFYTINNKEIVISNSSILLARTYKNEIDNNSVNEFMLTGYVTGEYTVYKGIYQVEPGVILEYSNDSLKKHKYFTYATDHYYNETFEELSLKFKKIIDDISYRLVESLQGRTAVIPLSGGYDSRLVAYMLKNVGYENVICFSYGRENNYESKISKMVAERLGFPWYFIEYNSTFIRKIVKSKDFENYLKYGFNGVSVSHIQDFFALNELKRKRIIPDNSIIIPGHTGDLFAGMHTCGLGKRYKRKKDIYFAIIKKHYNLYKISNYVIDIDRIYKYISTNYYAHSIIDNWDMENRQAKFIVNANRVYEYFGYEHRIPLWDKEIASFMKFVDIKYKNRDGVHSYIEKKNMYDFNILKKFKKYNVDFRKRPNNKELIIKKIKNVILFLLPISTFFSKILRIIKKYIHKNATKIFQSQDYCNFELISKELGFDLKKFANINSIIASMTIGKIKYWQ